MQVCTALPMATITSKFHVLLMFRNWTVASLILTMLKLMHTCWDHISQHTGGLCEGNTYIEKYLNDTKKIIDGLVGVVRPDDGLGKNNILPL